MACSFLPTPPRAAASNEIRAVETITLYRRADANLLILLLRRSGLRCDYVVHGATVSHDVFMRYDELLEWGLDMIESRYWR